MSQRQWIRHNVIFLEFLSMSRKLMSQLKKEHLEPVPITSGRKHACNFNFSSAPLTNNRDRTKTLAGHSVKSHAKGTNNCSITSNGFKGILNYFCKRTPSTICHSIVKTRLWITCRTILIALLNRWWNWGLGGPAVSDKARIRRQAA